MRGKNILLTLLFGAALAPAAAAKAVLCVKPGGGDGCYATIGGALALAEPGDMVRVAAGTYGENVTITENVTLEGGWNATFTARDSAVYTSIIEPSDATFSVVDIEGSFADPASSFPVLDGFTIRGGRADQGSNHGGGIRIRDSHATVRNCVVTNNRAYLFGGGIWVQRGAPRFERNRIENNVAVGDTALGGGIQLETGAVTIELVDNEFLGNSVEGTSGSGGGLHTSASTLVRVRGGRFEANRAATTCAGGQGGAIFAARLDVRSVTFRDNCALDSDAIATGASSIYGSLFVAGPPAAAGDQVRLESDSGGGRVENSTFVWTGPTPIGGVEIVDTEANAADYFSFDNNLFVGVSLVEVDTAEAIGDRNVFVNGATSPNPYLGTLAIADPMLDAQYRLLAGSPLVDAGIRGRHFRDVDGDPRPADAGSGEFLFDIGADELTGRPQRVFDLADDPADLTIIGPGQPPENPDSIGTSDWIGRAVLAEDVSGDGLDDLVVSAQDFADDFDTANAGGRLFGLLHFGERRTGVLDLASEPADFEATCDIELQHLGEELVAGDLDDDGALDLVAGASDTHDMVADAFPKAVVLFGGPDLAANGAAISSGALGDFALVAAEDSSSRFATINGIATGDLSGDAVDDLIVGDSSADAPGLDDAGAAYIVFGGATLGGVRDLAATAADATLFGTNGDGTFAASFDGGGVAIGDLDDDGQPDLVIRESQFAWILFGPIAGGTRSVPLSGDTQIHGLGVGGLVVLDMTGDGIDDLVLDSAGTLLVFAGPLARDLILGTSSAVYSIVHDATFGAQTLAAADVTGDPSPDLLVGDPADRSAFVVTPGLYTSQPIEEIASWILTSSSNAAARDLGFDVTGGDLDGDGRDDLVVGSWGTNDATRAPAFQDVGKAFVFYGDACGDGGLDAGESCDDANVAHGDGCAGWCVIETDHACVGEPSACGLDVARLAPGSVSGSSVATLGDLVGAQASLTSSLDLAHDGLALSFWLSLDAVFGAGDREVGGCTLPLLAAGASQSCDDTFVVPADLPLTGGVPTAYRWLACVDTQAGQRCTAGNTVQVPEPGPVAAALTAMIALGIAARRAGARGKA